MNYPYKPEEILRTRTSKILGGYLSEYFFEKRFCQNRNYTKKWWCSLNPIDNRLIFFVVGNTLLRIDEHILNKFYSHGGHPVLRWNMDNIFIRRDPAGNIKADIEKSSEKIDGAIATIMALDRAIRNGNVNEESVYDNRGLLFM